MNDIEINNSIMSSIDEYLGISCSRVGRYENYPYPQRLSFLSQNLRNYVLREQGDIKRYLELQSQIFKMAEPQKFEKSLFNVIAWLDNEMDSINPVTTERDVVVISLLAFGDNYIEKLLNYNFKSLMAFENLPCLAVEKQVVIYIQTDENGKNEIESSSITNKIKSLGVHFDYAVISDEVIESMKSTDIIYWLLGAGASLGLHYAKALKATFHHSFPDIIYSNKFFSELLRLSKQHKAILGSGFRSDETLMIPAIEPYIGDSISIPSDELIAHHMNCIHQVSWPMVVNNRPAYWLFPESHVMIWESEDLIHFNSPHVNGWWLDYEVIKDLPVRYYQTLDSEMDYICKGENYYMLQEDDQVYQCELSPPDRQSLVDIYCEAQQAARLLWTAVSHRDTAKFFFKEMRVKINRTIRPLHDRIIPKKHVAAMQILLYNTILSTDAYAGIKLAHKRTHEGYIFE